MHAYDIALDDVIWSHPFCHHKVELSSSTCLLQCKSMMWVERLFAGLVGLLACEHLAYRGCPFFVLNTVIRPSQNSHRSESSLTAHLLEFSRSQISFPRFPFAQGRRHLDCSHIGCCCDLQRRPLGFQSVSSSLSIALGAVRQTQGDFEQDSASIGHSIQINIFCEHVLIEPAPYSADGWVMLSFKSSDISSAALFWCCSFWKRLFIPGCSYRCPKIAIILAWWFAWQ